MTAGWPILALIAVLGLAIGSFLNVVIYRVPREESLLFPNSHCPSCNEPIKARHNVPVLSWMLLRGRCASCRAPISVRYPLVEAGTAVLFVATTMRFGLSVELPAYLYLAAVGVALTMIDVDVRRLPDSLVLPSYVVGVLLLMPAGAVEADWWSATRALVGMTAMWTVYFALALAYPNGVSFGDVKLAGLLGLYLGWLSWESILLGIFGSFLVGGVGGALAVVRRRRPQRAIPFGPYLTTAAILALFLAAPLTTWYDSLLAVA